MPTLEKSRDKMSENFSKMTPAMRRHLTMHLPYLQSDCKLLFLPGENRDDLPPELREQADAQGMEILFADTLAEIWAKCMEL